MAEKRMFSKSIIDSDMFLDMSLSTQALYFHLSMRADDDGFINNPKKIQRMIGANQNDMDMLLMKNFIIPFDSGVCVIKHWRIHNYIRSDRYKETLYKAEKQQLLIDENKAYTKSETIGIPDVNQMDTQDRLGKDRIELGKDRIELGKDKLELVLQEWNSLKLNTILECKGKRLEKLNALIEQYGIEKVKAAIKNIESSNFLRGENEKGWQITFDWFLDEEHFIKVFENNYKNKNVAGKFNSQVAGFKEKNYDYDALQNELLGWDENKEEETND